MSENWTRKDDLAAVINAAVCALNDALRDGDRGGKHPPGSWKAETVEEQLKHVEAHVTAYQCGDRSEDHLSRIVCRAAIAVALRYRSEQADLEPRQRSGGAC